MSQKNREDYIHRYFMKVGEGEAILISSLSFLKKVFQSNKSLGGNLVKLNVRYFNDQHQKEELYCRHYNVTSTRSILNKIKRRFDKIDRIQCLI